MIWVRVRDKVTGHEYDVTLGRLQILLQRGQVEEIPYLGRDGRHRAPRPAKHRPRTLGPPLTPRPTKAAGTTTSKKEDESR